ncbi:hypothetical protein ASPWEDRAFT_34325 [Aspergillus wentii DTO 134E9]|uniref:Uncharacterized protein n=1 Tax=Aspergillus wentii DTO 134E9 TaxID=1073089 RepID=A0A1L9S129_ASPWE|nr:uncharacterized protein ASPWEDRAFT_34325 [Aspergillus wentii DTO 134E9]OJJ40862.1 hypothetical protein ASPWEDRAFT_34325 [Aspergillus wentii DTO 134E9]
MSGIRRNGQHGSQRCQTKSYTITPHGKDRSTPSKHCYQDASTIQSSFGFGDFEPPQPKAMPAKILASTFYGTTPLHNLASYSIPQLYSASRNWATAGTEILALSFIQPLKWGKHSLHSRNTYSTASIAVPINFLLRSGSLISTFHSCLIS